MIEKNICKIKMKYLFGVVIPGLLVKKLDKDFVYLCGSIKELGQWTLKNCPKMSEQKQCPQQTILHNEPKFFQVELDLPSMIRKFDYKYVVHSQDDGELWEGKINVNRSWIMNEENIIDEEYYTPLDYWIEPLTDLPTNKPEEESLTAFTLYY
ncbi:unnamed protein product [Didymodactylos carnosus]|uniref:CBM20 domain-containing protein n=1 Tax=Didymodactylos carnosus TaxID=1234261 RepID=A0A814VZ19_9BILA|nr:unnamed protein product [Didymodactylos carnosus]CAF1344360.1 unnamed protein product [Didymodactylos carnosus]CAF3961423.1 unnamed protein product [Didymodactylos carnosus]CAF4155397.1 unnamed protein product [Didymodactylos carnosus]